MTPVVIDRNRVAAGLAARRDDFAGLVTDIPYERKGILYSEMLFFQVCACQANPKRILESGRARGQSTLILARSFPQLPVISVEYDKNSPDVPVAAERLKNNRNVDLRFGDATRILPELAQAGDVALIDGPKGHRGIRFALQLLATGRVPLVFVHDTNIGSPERRLLESLLPETVYSDEARFAEVSHQLDGAAGDDIPAVNRFQGSAPAAGYGFSLACIPYNPKRNYGLLLARTIWDGFAHRLLRRG